MDHDRHTQTTNQQMTGAFTHRENVLCKHDAIALEIRSCVPVSSVCLLQPTTVFVRLP